MKKAAVFFVLFICGVVATAVWFSPLAALGDAYRYSNNIPVEKIEGLCYAENTPVRVDFDGGTAELYSALEAISAKPVSTATAGDTTVVYAYSERVAAKPFLSSDGAKYNVMAAHTAGRVAIGTPILEGSY